MTKGKQQFQDCESDPSCKGGMSDELLSQGKRIDYFLRELDELKGMSKAQLVARKKKQAEDKARE